MSKHQRIFIIGHMGAGKGLVGKALADKLGWQFIDADFGLERSVGRTLNEIIGKQGEDALHQCESEILAHQLSKEKIVVVTDSCIISTEKNRKLLASEIVVYLTVSTPVQLERMSHPLPLFPIADRKVFLDKLHRERDSLYDEISSLTINTDNTQSMDSASFTDTLNIIIKTLD